MLVLSEKLLRYGEKQMQNSKVCPTGFIDFKGKCLSKEQLFSRAKEHFGTTNNYKETGWILPDGSMLDFSGKKEAASRIGKRGYDHRKIASILSEGAEGGEALFFFEKAGALRFSYIDRGNLAVSLDVNADLTEAQWKQLRKVVALNSGVGSYLEYDFDDDSKTLYSDYFKDIVSFDVYRLKKKFEEFKTREREYSGESRE